MLNLLWLIPVFPLAGALLLLAGGLRFPKLATTIVGLC